MRYNVPQFIDVEDTIVGPLTAKQLLWLFAMAAVLFIAWFTVGEKTVFFVIGIPVALLFIALAFYKPQGQPFLKFIIQAALFFVRPKIYMWRRDDTQERGIKRNIKKKNIGIEKYEKKKIRQEELIDLAKILDSESDILRK
jgi:PrgI family protein